MHPAGYLATRRREREGVGVRYVIYVYIFIFTCRLRDNINIDNTLIRCIIYLQNKVCRITVGSFYR